ncbi:hypothetical protein IQ235_05430 [Oscillatoriales cyanobacterium LEGE 11467]|uniref:Uncharacterized protein n=1 Tax=Zarconia navalis LEGE 11467 TaxID=1828826 RepID=A0A928VVU9_9CYAN|nr:hypothetical protein [Zarconia navalis LEGE 11467]
MITPILLERKANLYLRSRTRTPCSIAHGCKALELFAEKLAGNIENTRDRPVGTSAVFYPNGRAFAFLKIRLLHRLV